MEDISCFKAYDIRGEIGVTINEEISYCVGRAVAQHFSARSVVVGYDARETSPKFANAISKGVMDAGGDVLNIGLSGTEEMYWGVTKFDASAGIMVTASHNPINYNGMKIVKKGSRPLDNVRDFQLIKRLVGKKDWASNSTQGNYYECQAVARNAYVDRVLSFADLSLIKPLKIVVNSGNGAAGPTFDAISKILEIKKVPLEFVKLNHSPDPTFPNGIPNPLLPQNREQTTKFIKSNAADFGIAFDGDFDRCFFFDEFGEFVPGEYLVGLLASIFLEKEKGSKIVHDTRVIWNTQDIIYKNKGIAVSSKPGHSFIKQIMREHKAIYGGEISAHHYFRDFAYCDSGMIPWILVSELLSQSGKSLNEFVKERSKAFPSSGEKNFTVKDPDRAIANVLLEYQLKANNVDKTDGISLSFDEWRFNLRKSNTEPLVRLNIESKGNTDKISSELKIIEEKLMERGV